MKSEQVSASAGMADGDVVGWMRKFSQSNISSPGPMQHKLAVLCGIPKTNSISLAKIYWLTTQTSPIHYTQNAYDRPIVELCPQSVKFTGMLTRPAVSRPRSRPLNQGQGQGHTCTVYEVKVMLLRPSPRPRLTMRTKFRFNNHLILTSLG